ncbi:MAG: carboxylesterase family protein [Lewinella sp.]|nr:carboxylesterase family protein [Lewinella sp.]
MRQISFLLAWSFMYGLYGQVVSDTVYTITTATDLPYAAAVDFAGNERQLTLDLSVPTDDEPPACGRPLLLVIHGGAWLAGSKDDGTIRRMREDFAKRGYATAAINYRLGLFQTSSAIHCNATNFGLAWDCLQAADSSEWYRANYRGIQDAHAALRYLTVQADNWQIDPQQVFLIGESAGAFIALGTGFIDRQEEVLTEYTSAQADLNPPNPIYEAPCIQGLQLDTSLASLQLSRPDLGTFTGQPLTDTLPYRIRGVAAFYGAVFNDIWATANGQAPTLYLFHQPNDLIVPIGYQRLLQGYAACLTGFPFNCSNIYQRPHAYGSQAIAERLTQLGSGAPELQLEITNNFANCAVQVLDPSQQGHRLDGYWLRTSQVASLFAAKVGACLTATDEPMEPAGPDLRLFPNPLGADRLLHIRGDLAPGDQIRLWTSTMQLSWTTKWEASGTEATLALPAQLPAGVYLLEVIGPDHHLTKTLILR